MAQTTDGALLIASKKTGLSVIQYAALKRLGFKWCSNCKGWHKTDSFNNDSTRYDGLAPSCRASMSIKSRESYVRSTKKRVVGRRYVSARENDKQQARRRVNYLVESSLIPNPNNIPCTDCGHCRDSGDIRRHEYDHFNGYSPENHESVEAVCSLCHHRREEERRIRYVEY